jgi:hypothetical protein
MMLNKTTNEWQKGSMKFMKTVKDIIVKFIIIILQSRIFLTSLIYSPY